MTSIVPGSRLDGFCLGGNRLLWLQIALLSSALLVACPKLDLGDVPFLCGETAGGDRACPSGYDCVEGYCVRPGANPPNGNNGPEEPVPVADAGPDQRVFVNELVELSGLGSSDPEDRSLTFSWEQVSGTEVELSDPQVAGPTFTAPSEPGLLVFSLVVVAGEVESEPDTVSVEVVLDDEEPVCGEERSGCSFADFSEAEGDFVSGDVRLGEAVLRATRSVAVPVKEITDGCVFVTSMLSDSSRAQLSQTFRVDSAQDGRMLEGIEIGPLNWWPADRMGPQDATLTLTLMLPGTEIPVSHPTSIIGGVAVRFDFSEHRIRLQEGEVYEMRLSTDLPIESDPRIAWLAVTYENPSCLDDEGEMRWDDDPSTFLRYCSSAGVCGQSLNGDGVFLVDAAPRASVTLAGENGDPLSSSTLDAEIEGGVIFDLFVDRGDGGWEEAALGASLDQLIEGATTAERFLMRMSFVDRPASVACLESCLVSTLPHVEIRSGPPPATKETEASFVFDCGADSCEYECALDGGDFTDCSSPLDLMGLEDGEHELRVRASIQGEARFGAHSSFEWLIDTVAPITSFVVVPDDPSYSDTATFEFSCDKAPCDFECSLDGAPYASCSSPVLLYELDGGTHSYAVFAIDSLGNEGEPSEFLWTVGEEAWIEVSSGREHSCAIREDSTLWCWGRNDRGQLGIGTLDDKSSASRVGSGSGWTNVSAGDYFTCALREQGELWCWGANDEGQTGTGEATMPDDLLVPTRVDDSEDWRSIAAGGWHACAIDAAGGVWCWGYNYSGQVGDGTELSPADRIRPSPTRVQGETTGWASVDAGMDHSCAVFDGYLWCWGLNSEGQLGSGKEGDARAPVEVIEAGETQLGGIAAVAAGESHSCAIGPIEDSYLYCWGSGQQGQTGQGVVAEPSREALLVAPGDPIQGWTDISLGRQHSCGVLAGEVFCWGANSLGQAGSEGTEDVLAPTAILVDSPGLDFTSVAAGGDHACAISDGGKVLCWGSNSFGQLGDGQFGGSRHIASPIAR